MGRDSALDVLGGVETNARPRELLPPQGLDGWVVEWERVFEAFACFENEGEGGVDGDNMSFSMDMGAWLSLKVRDVFELASSEECLRRLESSLTALVGIVMDADVF